MSRMQASPELRLMFAPVREYARLASQDHKATALGAITRPALLLLILGAASAAASTGRVDAWIVLSGIVCWGFVVAIQLIAALAVVRSAPNRRLEVRRALRLWFFAHAPWSLWILAAAAAAFAIPSIMSLEMILVSALVPSVWTAALVFAFCRHVLGEDRRRAGWRTIVHQCVTWSLIIGYLAVVTQIWPRIVGWLAA